MKEGEDPTAGYTFPPDQVKDYDYNDYYMHYYQQAYHAWTGWASATKNCVHFFYFQCMLLLNRVYGCVSDLDSLRGERKANRSEVSRESRIWSQAST